MIIHLQWAGGIQTYFLKNGDRFASLFTRLAIGLLTCFSKRAPNLAAGKAPTTILRPNYDIWTKIND